MDDVRARGWDGVDFTYVCGDAYVDQSSFGMAIISRVLESHGYKVGIIAQPDWRDPESVNVFGEPRLGFLSLAGLGVSSANSAARRPSSSSFASRFLSFFLPIENAPHDVASLAVLVSRRDGGRGGRRA